MMLEIMRLTNRKSLCSVIKQAESGDSVQWHDEE